MKTIVTETALKTKFWSVASRIVACFLGNGFTVPQPRPKFLSMQCDILFIFIIACKSVNTLPIFTMKTPLENLLR